MASHSWLTCTFWALAAAVSAYTPVATLPACTRRAPGYTCGKAGSLAAPKPLSVTTNVQNIDSCRIQCLQEQSYDGCLSFGYDANRKQCSTFAATLASMRFTASASSSTTYYAYGCFKCLDKCPQSTEPLVYPGFEQAMSSSGPLSPWVGAQVISPGHNSKRAAYDQSYFEISQKIVTCPGQLYEVTFDYMISYYSPSAHHLRVRVGDLTSENYIYTNSNNNTWRTFRSSFQPIYYEDPTQLTISMDSNADGFVERRKSKFWVDNVRVTPSTAPLSAAAGAPELVKNGGFENRAVEPFNVTGSPQPAGKANITFVAPGFEGSRYAVQYNPVSQTSARLALLHSDN